MQVILKGKCHSMGMRLIISFSFILLLSATLHAETSQAEARSGLSDEVVRGRLSASGGTAAAGLQSIPLALSGGSTLTFVSPEQWAPLSKELSVSLDSTHSYFVRLFGEIPELDVSIHLMEEEDFYRSTGVPRWTNALFYRNKITIPLSENANIDKANLARSIRHEYTHAVIHALSDGRAPGWLDEGLSQWAEGAENTALKPALMRWLNTNDPIPLAILQGGFTRLSSRMVPASYAQSLFGANTMINTYGFRKIRTYFDALKDGRSKDAAFIHAFGVSEREFEDRLGQSLKNWHHDQKRR